MSPLVGEYHTKFWERTSTGTHAIIPVPSAGGYPTWQSSVIAPSGLGMLGAWWDSLSERIGWWWHLCRQIAALSTRGKAVVQLVVEALDATPEPYLRVTVGADLSEDAKARAQAAEDYQADAEAVLTMVAHALQHPAYGAAHLAVRRTAQTIGFNEPQAWVQLSHKLKARGSWAENTWRHLNACDLTETAMQAQGSTLSNGQRHLLVQLAYAGFAKRRR